MMVKVKHSTDSKSIPKWGSDLAAETRLMKFVEYIGAHVNVSNYIGKGLAEGDKFFVTVQKVIKGYMMTQCQERNKEAVIALGVYMRKFHDASRQFCKEYPDLAKGFPTWKNRKFPWDSSKTKPPSLPEDEQHYGLIHANLESGHKKIYFDGTEWQVGTHMHDWV